MDSVIKIVTAWVTMEAHGNAGVISLAVIFVTPIIFRAQAKRKI